MLLETLNNNVVCGTLRVVDQTIHYETIAEIERRINWSLLFFEPKCNSFHHGQNKSSTDLFSVYEWNFQTVHAINSL